MLAATSIFFDIRIPNPTTWFYFSGLLAVALFFKFSRFFSMRNLDVLTLYLFMPGLLLLSEGGAHQFLGYLWLMIACLYFLVRCLVDLALTRRPALGTNLHPAGLAWLTGALFMGLIAVAVREPPRPNDDPRDDVARSPTDDLRKIGERTIRPYAPNLDDSGLRRYAERSMALLCHLSVVLGLVFVGRRHFDDLQAGMSAATFYLLLPYTYMLLPDSPLGVGRWDHAWAMALVVWAILCYRRPIVAGAFLGVATGTTFYLLVALPAWVSFYRDRGATRFAVSFVVSAGLGLAVLGILLWAHGEMPPSLQSDWTRFDWQPWKRPAADTPGFWQNIPSASVAGMPAAYRVPLFIAAMTLVLTAGLWPFPKNLAQVIALSAATLISIQFWYADRGGVYVLWFIPLLLLLVFRPNLSNARPPVPPADDWPAQLGGWLRRRTATALQPLAGLWPRRPDRPPELPASPGRVG
ncbi:MAG: hypothetical protein U0736_01595 [Gemmataceae bacterium]